MPRKIKPNSPGIEELSREVAQLLLDKLSPDGTTVTEAIVEVAMAVLIACLESTEDPVYASTKVCGIIQRQIMGKVMKDLCEKCEGDLEDE